MKLAVIGTGYVGLVSGTCFAELGYTVICVDKDEDKIAQLQRGTIPIYEPGLEALVAKNAKAGRLRFTTDITAASSSDVVFIAVGTPTGGDGVADLRYVFAAAAEIGAALKQGQTLIVTKSTVPVGTGEKVAAILKEHAPPGAAFDVASNPEFLREGSAIADFMQPDRIVIGTRTQAATAQLAQLYAAHAGAGVPIVATELRTAELIKYASNSFLATKIGFINEIADICEKLGTDVEEVARGIGLDKRIGEKFLKPGPGFGGSCFPKDAIALITTAKEVGCRIPIIEATIEANEKRKEKMVEKIVAACGGSVRGKTIAVLGLAFKANTDDVRYSAALTMIPRLLEQGATVRATDPEAMEQARKQLTGGVTWCADAYDAAQGADAAVIVTEWEAFATLDLPRLKRAMHQPVIVDLRNLYAPETMQKAGFSYVSVGRLAVAKG